ncbi:hypothetical protein [Methylobacterium oxalidis]|uniref:Uncharacterized protein n=1 Tax=Methylobacterium oxalidis TaxID=944322 RepID=A0A512J7U2_9HYPH|nr:hypothetical protein [Methylobacterium oxalidis]GEP06035.1 hypothetical protein MOX02_40730 [Methylobacterium oxalidis]GJE35698.1 hypothetical protein LDDCCGHA_5918 [Methylobacterium oxalidis]GLS65754.1 hypothetical protein GCM10007888_41360 [Methylobacterium oxalidis]
MTTGKPSPPPRKGVRPGGMEAKILAQAKDPQRVSELLAEKALQDAIRRRRNQPARYDVKIDSAEDGTLRLAPSTGGEVTDLARRLNAFGTPSVDFAAYMVGQVATAARSAGRNLPTSAQLNAALAVVDGTEPENETEAMLAVQMFATHDAAMAMLGSMKQAGDVVRQQETGNLAIKLLRTYTAQMETLAKLRRGGEQKVRVEHVHVYPGGQAVVGDVTVNGGSNPVGQEPQRLNRQP